MPNVTTPSRVVEYKGHEIQVYVLFPDQAGTFRAKYEICGPGSGLLWSGVIAGAFGTAHEAEDGAVRAAMHTIDR